MHLIDWNPIIANVLGALLSAIAVALVGYLVQLARKQGLEITADQQARLEYFAKQAALKVEELAAAKLLPKADKLDVATLHVMDAVPGTPAERARATVLAALPELPGIGAVDKPIRAGGQS